jgi:hypothetical protein
MLFYYKTKADYDQLKTCKGVINFQQIGVAATYSPSEQRLKLTLDGSKRCFDLKFLSDSDYNYWVQKVNHCIDRSMGRLKGLSLMDYTDDVN